MFRKPFVDYNSRGPVPLREFDRRRLKNVVVLNFSVAPDVAEALIPGGLFSVAFENHERIPGVAYITSESVPLWFTLGKNTDDLVPTVYTLWKHPDLLSILSIPGKSVPAMLHGPFLLVPDVEITFQPSASIPTGKLVCITQGYPPTASGVSRVGPALAVARMDLPSHLVEGGTKGKALTLLHAWKDQLWVTGGEERPPRPRLLDGTANGEDDNEGWASEEIEEVAEFQPENSGCEDIQRELSPEEVSKALRSALLQSISVTLSKLPPGSFPITPSIFYETYILPYRSFQVIKHTTTPVDMKRSGFKSLTVFLKASAKEGLVKIKESKGGMVVTGIDGSHPNVRAHVRHLTAKEVEVHKEKREEVQAQEIEKAEMQHRERVVTLLRKPGPISAPFFQSIGKDPEALLTEEEVKNIVNQYLTSKRLLKTRDKNTINIAQDKLLLDIVSNGKEVDKAKLLEKRSMDVDEVIKKVVGSTKAWYKISTGDRQPVIREGKPHPISINIVCRHGDHTVTYVSGFEIFRLDAESLAEELKTACASSTAVQPNIRDCESNLKQIMVQGEHVQAVTESLITRGIQRRWIEVINRTGVKLKKTQAKKRSLT